VLARCGNLGVQGSSLLSCTYGQWRPSLPPIRPVLKHGPRSLTCAQVNGWKTQRRNESKDRFSRFRWDPRKRRTTAPSNLLARSVAEERTRWDPKDGELCLSRMKPEETLVEVRSGSDVQIDRQTWV
jgi:hypothetical protein